MPPAHSVTPSRRPARARPPRADLADLAGLARLSVLATVLGLALLGLVGVGRRLPTPPLGPHSTRSAEAWSTWFARLGPAGATMSAVRLAALVLAAYLLALVVIEVVGRAVGLPRLLSLGHLVSTPRARQLIGGVAGIGMALSIAAATVGPVGVASADAGPVMHALDTPSPSPSPSSTADGTTMTSLASEPPVMRALDPTSDPSPSTTPSTAGPVPTSTTAPLGGSTDPADPADPAGTTATAPIDRPGPAVPSPAPAPAPGSGQWVIRGGDHLWGVARRTLAGSWHRAPTDAETVRYLDRLIEANLDVLVVAGDADLVFPGQVFLLPSVPAG